MMNRNRSDLAMPERPTLAARLPARLRGALYVLLSQYVTNGLSVAIGLLVILLFVAAGFGVATAASAGVGVLITTMPDVASPRHRKLMQMLPAPLLATPMYALVQYVHHDALQLGIVIVLGTFGSVMLMSWGKRGGPITFAVLIAMILAIAEPAPDSLRQIWMSTGGFALGCALYLVWAVLMTHLLNPVYRVQLLAESMVAFAKILRVQAARLAPEAGHHELLSAMLAQQITLADYLQGTRDVVLESPTTRRRQRLATMMLALVEARDHQLACDLDLDYLLKHHASASVLTAPLLRSWLETAAAGMEQLALEMLLGRAAHATVPTPDLREWLHGALPVSPDANRAPLPLTEGEPDADALLHSMANRIGHLHNETIRMARLARGDEPPALAQVRLQWQLFVSPTQWTLQPLKLQLAWHAPVLRYALRATLAVAVGYLLSLHLPWQGHGYWVMLTTAVVMRGNLAQTVQRRNARVAGTLLGCLLVAGLLTLHPSGLVILLVVALTTGMSHAFALRRYLYTTVAATFTALLLAHMLEAGLHPTFAAALRMADTLLGAVIAWLFSYILPAWERTQIPPLVTRCVNAQRQHARLALALLDAAQTSDLPWRLARREAYDSLAALTLTLQRTVAEPRQVRLPVQAVEALQSCSYQLLGQLAAIKSLLLLRRPQLNMAVAQPALQQAAQRIQAALAGAELDAGAGLDSETITAGQPFQPRPDPLVAADLTPWLLRRLRLACAM
ncbi:MAG: FUSC family protein, partial [Rhodoferax sp.]